MRTLLLAALLAAPLGSLTACASLRAPGPDPVDGTKAGAGATVPQVGVAVDPEAPEVPGNTSLGVNDIFEVRVYDEAELSGMFRVGGDGTVDYPLCGRLTVGGRTAADVSDLISQCLQAGYLRSPQVTVVFKENNSKKVFVFGQVQKPGTFSFADGMSVVEAVTLAGGFTRMAAKNQVIVKRVVSGREQVIKVPVEDIGAGGAPNFLLQPGDIVWVPESFF